MSRVTERMMANNKKSTFVLQLTAMVDMFTILLVFLLKSFSTSAINITPAEGLKLPYSSSYTEPVEALKIMVSNSAIFVEDTKILDLREGQILKTDLDASDNDRILSLYGAMEKEYKKSLEISQKNESVKFNGHVVMQADQELDYAVLQKVMYTAALVGYTDLKLATIAAE